MGLASGLIIAVILSLGAARPAPAAAPAVQEYEQRLPSFSKDSVGSGEEGLTSRFISVERGASSPARAVISGIPAAAFVLAAALLMFAIGSRLVLTGPAAGDPDPIEEE